LSAALTFLYHTKVISLGDLVMKMSINPQRILGVKDFAVVKEGIEANFCLVDINREWTVTREELHSLSRNSCFLNHTLKGKVTATVCRGTLYKFN